MIQQKLAYNCLVHLPRLVNFDNKNILIIYYYTSFSVRVVYENKFHNKCRRFSTILTNILSEFVRCERVDLKKMQQLA